MWEESYSRLLLRIELLKFFAAYLAGNLCAPVTASLDDFASMDINIGSVKKFIKSFDPVIFFCGEVNKFAAIPAHSLLSSSLDVNGTICEQCDTPF